MARLKCPKCGALLSAAAVQGVEVRPCPSCGQKVRLRGPGAETPANQPTPPPRPEAVTGALPRRPAARVEDDGGGYEVVEESGYEVVEESRAPAPAPPSPLTDLIDEEDLEDLGLADQDPKARRRRKRRKKKRRDGERMDRLIPWVGNEVLGVGSVFLVGAGMAALSLLIPWLQGVLICYGLGVLLVGAAWLYMRGVEDGMELFPRPGGAIAPNGMVFALLILFLGGLLVLYFVVLSVIYFVTNLERAWPPFVTTVLGIGFLILGIVLASGG